MNLYDYETELQELTETADSIAWDGCHKIYILQDSDQTDQMKNNGYYYLWTRDQIDSYSMLNTIKQWYRESCHLRFINSVATDYDNTDLFTQVVPQS
jgi:hypothetical protein